MNNGPFAAGRFVILGATGGIGSHTARRLYRDGHSTFLAGRDRGRLDALARDLRSPSKTFEAKDHESVTACIHAARDEFGGLDGVAHCAGSLLLKPAHLTTPEEWESTLATNLTSSFFVVRAAAPVLRSSGGSIVLVSSAAGRLGMSNHEAIAAAKAGVIGLTLASAATYAGQNVRVNCVAPGLVDTPLAERITANPTALAASEAMHALGRIGKPEDVASAICWLLNAEQAWMTGQVIGVDGGLATTLSRKRS